MGVKNSRKWAWATGMIVWALLASAAVAQQEYTPASEPTEVAEAEEMPGLGVTLDATYTSKYLWRGYDLFDDHAAFQPSVDVDLFGTGFGVNVWGSIPLGTGSNNQGGGINQWQEYDYTAYYGTSFFEGEAYELAFAANYIYYHFPKLDRIADTQELGVGLEMPALLTIGETALVPSYYVGKLWPNSSSTPDVSGWYHTLGLAYEVPVPTTDLALSLGWDINYNDGLFGADSDWSHSTVSLSTSAMVGPFSVSPFLNYQISMEDTVNDEDELYGGVSVSLSF